MQIIKQWNGGVVLGYDLEDVSNQRDKRKHTKLVINEKEAKTIRHMFELYISGNGYKAIANKRMVHEKHHV